MWSRKECDAVHHTGRTRHTPEPNSTSWLFTQRRGQFSAQAEIAVQQISDRPMVFANRISGPLASSYAALAHPASAKFQPHIPPDSRMARAGVSRFWSRWRRPLAHGPSGQDAGDRPLSMIVMSVSGCHSGHAASVGGSSAVTIMDFCTSGSVHCNITCSGSMPRRRWLRDN